LTAFNAIKLSPREVAETFISSPAFEALLRADNAILSGPRGSGKTTLLKMLQSEALETWQDANARKARDDVRAVGVFVGTDRTWNEQLGTPGLRVLPQDREMIAWGAFGTHTFKSLVAAMNFRVRGRLTDRSRAHLRVTFSAREERELSEHLSTLFQFDETPSSLAVLSQMLSDRLAALGMIRRRLRAGRSAEIPGWADLDVITVVDAAAASFNRTAAEPDQTWALLFDELELAPASLVEDLLGALRGNQPRLVFKLSLSPANDTLNTLDGPHAPVPGQDYEYVPLTHARKTATLKFAKELVRRTLVHAGLEPLPTVDRLLGDGDLDSTDDPLDPDDPYYATKKPRAAPYATGAFVWERMHALAERDPSFAAYLLRNGMDLRHLDRLSPGARASRLRKVRNLVLVREYYRSSEGRRRSRKSFALYAGTDNILSLPDGNPRMLIALTRALIPAVRGSGVDARVPKPAQGAAIEFTLSRFLPLLEAQDAVRVDGRLVTLMQLLDYVGTALARRLVEQDFNENARLTFSVDENVRSEVLELLCRGVNTGALVYVPPRDEDGRLRGSILRKQFRLSHLLATKYGLPIHLTKSSPISQLLPNHLCKRPVSRRRPRSRADSEGDNQPAFQFNTDGGDD
jgi:hypothetical protein